jgi:hypothetical protein
MKVIRRNTLEIKPGGIYELSGYNETEERIAKLRLLSHFINLAEEHLAESGENNVLFGTRLENLADELFELYKPFIEADVDIFSYANYYDRAQLKRYSERPLVGGGMNASKEESTNGLPEGWWYYGVYCAHKWFSFGNVAVSYDEFLKVNTYEGDGLDRGADPVNWIHIKEQKDYAELFTSYPEDAAEIAMACRFIKETSNPQI